MTNSVFSSYLTIIGSVFHIMAIPINNIDSKGHKLELKSSRDYLTNHTRSKSHYCLFMASGWTRRHTDNNFPMKGILRNLVCAGVLTAITVI